MKLEIDCPDCGYNLYLVKEHLTGKELQVSVGKCDAGGCDLIIENEEPQNHKDFEELTYEFNNRFKIIKIIDGDCIT